jgi:hypothetical protein
MITRHGRQRVKARPTFPDQISMITMTNIVPRSRKMYLMQEALARARMRQLQDEAAAERVARGLMMVRRAARKVDEAKVYARRALASAVAYD